MTNDKDQSPAELNMGGTETNQGLKKKGAAIIHTMPKSFLSSTAHGKDNTKRVGLFILVGGGVLLLVIFVAAYYYLTIYNPKVNTEAISPIEETEEYLHEDDEIFKSEPVAPPPTSPDIEIKQKEAVKEVDIKRVDIATSTSLDATSTEVEIEPAPAVFSYSSDSDQDGLSDLEEVLLGTDLQKKDSDNDGYDDKSELLNLYNPGGVGAIVTNPKIKKYTNAVYRYSLYYPDAWSIERVGNDESIMIKLDNNQFFQIIVSQKTDGLSIEDWYKKEFSVPVINLEQKLYKQGWNGVKSENSMTFYLVYPGEEKLYTVTYNLGLQRIISYQNIFEMMINSLERN
ncbi:hypothetical protein KAR28_05785 [Candidatus Parcubacteria bacterium]|nr:hypothetical protein [Candidatus Parcubacteria bacterium]